MSVKKWLLTLLLLCIPVVDIIMLFIWAFGSDSDERKNFARAVLLWSLVVIVISIILSVVGLIGSIALFSIGS